MLQFIDQIGRKVQLRGPTRRIISLVPSQTELLYDLGLDSEVIGITKFCVHPGNWRSEKNIIGGTKNLNIEKIKSLKPDLIIANKEENEQKQIEVLSELFPVWTSDIQNLEDALLMITELGNICAKPEVAKTIIVTITKNFSTIDQRNNDKKLKVLYLIWKDPYLSVGKDTFIHDMLTRCGFQNCLENQLRYPELTSKQVTDLKPDLIFLSSEPYPFSNKQFPEFYKILPNSSIHLVDGEMFSWYGSHLIKACDYFKSILIEVNSPS